MKSVQEQRKLEALKVKDNLDMEWHIHSVHNRALWIWLICDMASDWVYLTHKSVADVAFICHIQDSKLAVPSSQRLKWLFNKFCVWENQFVIVPPPSVMIAPVMLLLSSPCLWHNHYPHFPWFSSLLVFCRLSWFPSCYPSSIPQICRLPANVAPWLHWRILLTPLMHCILLSSSCLSDTRSCTIDL